MEAGLQAERTTLAWQRTGLATSVVALVMLRLAVLRSSLLIGTASAVVVFIAAAAIVEGALRHSRRMERVQTSGAHAGLPLTGPALAAACTVLGTAGALLSLIG